MTEVGGASPGPALTPVEARGRGPSAWVALGLFAAALVALVGISLVGQPGGRPGSQAAVASGPTATPTATPIATPSPTAPPTPPRGTPPPRVAVAVGPVPTCPPGSTPDTPGPVDQARPPMLSHGHGIRPPGGQAGGPRCGADGDRRDVDVRRVHEHLDPDASRTGSRPGHWRARLRRRLRRDDRA